ncbi:hypothetical protein [Paenibacillus sp. PL2-23]|uniref:hypothetical protein n=1 Tax=Paenibacillus sp. PL2-23 TaxID=2100729 RepID=UPI0030F5B4EB
MTAEIAVLNRSGVALAADSAVTVGSNKIFNSADKLFALNKHSIGIMIYGNANLMNVPWETVISMFRKKLPDVPFSRFTDYCDSFIGYLTEEQRFTSKEAEKGQIGFIFSQWLEKFLKKLNQFIHNNYQHEPDEDEIRKIMNASLVDTWNQLNEIHYSGEFDETFYPWFEEEYGEFIQEIFEENVNFELNEDIINTLVIIAASLVCRNTLDDNESGVVIAGFGEDDIYPTLSGYRIGGIFNGKLKQLLLENSKIDDRNSAQIVPFAQQEMVHSFLSGIDPKIEDEIQRFLQATVSVYPDFIETLDINVDIESKAKIEDKGRELSNEFENELKKFKRKQFINPVIQTVASFPKEELSSMAEALVNLTSIKRKVTNQAETVGGPIDVAVISKSDGFIWVKRKQYYQTELNS